MNRYDNDPDWGVYDGVFSRRNLTEILDAYAVLRSPWVKTADRLPDKCDETKYLIARQRICGEWHTLEVTGLYIKKYPTRCPWWIPIPPLPEDKE